MLTTVSHSQQESISLSLFMKHKVSRVHITQSSSAATAITHLNQMFTTHGIPEVITSDPFGSEEFTAWCKQLGIKHHKIMPL